MVIIDNSDDYSTQEMLFQSSRGKKVSYPIWKGSRFCLESFLQTSRSTEIGRSPSSRYNIPIAYSSAYSQLNWITLYAALRVGR